MVSAALWVIGSVEYGDIESTLIWKTLQTKWTYANGFGKIVLDGLDYRNLSSLRSVMTSFHPEVVPTRRTNASWQIEPFDRTCSCTRWISIDHDGQKMLPI